MKKKFHVLQLDQSTVAQQVELFNQVFNHRISEADWLYKHRANPLSSQYNVLGAVDCGEIIGINGFMPMNFQIGGQVFKAVQSCDSAVSPDYRGQGVYSKILTSAETLYKELSVDFLFGFPNKKTYPADMKMGWLHLLDLHTISLLSRITPILEMKLKMRIPKLIDRLISWRKLHKLASRYEDIKVSVSDSSPFYDDEYERINRCDKLVLWKSPEIVKWKLDENPSRKFRYYVAKRCNVLLAYLIVEERKLAAKMGVRQFRVVDWGFSSDDWNDLACSSAKMLLMMKSGADLISLWMPTEARYRSIFKELGFKLNHYFPVNPVVIKILTGDEQKVSVLQDKRNWQPKFIDADTLL